MTILCVADHIDPLVYSTQAKERYKDIDLVLSAGDLPMQYLGFISGSLNKPVLFVFGNHNLEHYDLFKRRQFISIDVPETLPQIQNYFGSTCIGGRVVKRKGLLLAGLGGSRRYNAGKNQYTNYQMWLKVMWLIPKLLWNRIRHGRYLDILLTHASPKGIHDKPDACHQGFSSFLWFMRRFKPRYLLHGHIHLYDRNEKRETQYHDTLVINVYDHYVLKIEDEPRE
ncbi:MAG: metallophosphoesterase [Spirochaetaceae bacterium]|nr:MAG: metallophosphoesterase [Spirochaetaceae bacterium]